MTLLTPTGRALFLLQMLGPLTVADFERRLSLSADQVKRHLRMLRDAELIEAVRSGSVHYWQTTPDCDASAAVMREATGDAE